MTIRDRESSQGSHLIWIAKIDYTEFYLVEETSIYTKKRLAEFCDGIYCLLVVNLV